MGDNPHSGRIKVKALLVKKGVRSKSKEKPKFYKDVQPIGQNAALELSHHKIDFKSLNIT